VTPTQVLALRPAAGGYRLAWARERLQDAFWPIPAGSPQVVRRLLAAYQTLERRLAPGLAGAIRLRREELLTQAAGQGVGPELARPDAMGLG
jgi:hypothetical protein